MSDMRQRKSDQARTTALRHRPGAPGQPTPMQFDQAPGSPGFMASPVTLLVVSIICLLLVSTFWPLIRGELDIMGVEWFERCRGLPLLGQSGVCEFLRSVAKGKVMRWYVTDFMVLHYAQRVFMSYGLSTVQLQR